ncbi:hypothetical protein AUR64_19015 [Haloprofundus marisrubri]|uniref:DUF8215 domain-containing protein n=2 Tax=Haloprofundus marisrubri TaxID=1514971 RepID=A0A0W1R6B9_9EURY|nr:hypothetical protein AUR64_19015 [Haloprofundus marisrubri]
MEVSFLSLPVLVLLLGLRPAGPVSAAALASLTTTVVAVGSFRGRYFDVGAWPRVGQFRTMPIRSAYYGGVIGAGTYLGTTVHVGTGMAVLGVFLPALLAVLALAALPRVLGGLFRASKASL